MRPDGGLPIFSLNVRFGGSWLHPRFVTTLLNDLFGIQTRAGCSCAAPYGHRLLHIDTRTSDRLHETIRCGNIGLKPGWTRVTFHFLHTEREVDFIAAAIRFVADHGVRFLPVYRFDVHTGAWRHHEAPPARAPTSFAEALRGSAGSGATGRSAASAAGSATPCDDAALGRLFDGYLAEAGRLAGELARRHAGVRLKTTEGDLVPFVYV